MVGAELRFRWRVPTLLGSWFCGAIELLTGVKDATILVLVQVDASFGRSELDTEISGGYN